MNMGQCFQMAFKNIWSNKLRALLTMLGIIIGVAAVIVIVGLGNGLENYISDSFSSMGTTSVTASIMGRGSSRSVSVEDMYELVADNPDVLASVSPTVTVSSTVKIDTETLDSTTVTGVGEDYANMKEYGVTQGRFLQYVDVLKRMKVAVIGSYINQTYYNGNGVGSSIRIGGAPYTIIGVLDEVADSTEGSSDDCVYLPYTQAAKMSWTGTINSYTFNAASEDTVDAAVTLIEDDLYSVFESDSSYTVTSMSEMLETMTSMINMVVLVLAAIAAISLVVGGIGIMNIMLVSVTERTREIGIRKALGAKQRHILAQFVIEAGTTSALGGIFGIGIGYGLSAIGTQIVTSLMSANVTISPTLSAVALAFGVSVAIGVVFGYLPAKKAAALNPIDALHYE